MHNSVVVLTEREKELKREYMKLGGWGCRNDLGGDEREKRIHCVNHSIMNTILGLQFLKQNLNPS